MAKSFARWAVPSLLLLSLSACGVGMSAAPTANPTKGATLTSIAAAKSIDNEIRAEQPVTGALERTDQRLSDGSYYDLYRYRGRRGERVQITLESSAFEAYLLLARDIGTDVEVMARSDNSGRSLRAQIPFELPEDGTYLIAANSLAVGAVGPYTLRLESQRTQQGGQQAQQHQPATAWGSRYPGGGDPGERYALLVGIEDYNGIGSSLDGPVADARLMGRILVDRYGFRPENVIVITDRDATREHIAQAFLRHLGQAGPGGSAVFYYSGHGVQMDGNYALTGQDDPEPDGVDEALFVWGAGRQGGIILDDELGLLANQLRTDRMLFIIDACFSGTGTRGGRGGQSKEVKFADVKDVITMPTTFLTDGTAMSSPPPGAKGVSDLMREPQRHVLLAASADDQVSWTASGWPKYGGTISVFTYYLAEALEHAGSRATFAEVMQGVRDRTSRYTQSRYNARQSPQVEGRQRIASIDEFLRGR